METVKIIFDAIVGLALFAGILYLSYVATKYLANRLSPTGRGGKNLKVVETLGISKDTSLLIVKAGEKMLLIGTTANSVSLVTELSPDELDFSDEKQAPQTMSFAEALKININKRIGKEQKKNCFEEDKNDKKSDS